MTKYLYGANVKSVQQFIFRTGRLTEIIGGSEIVEQICTSLFKEQVNAQGVNEDTYEKNLIVSAAGIIKFIFDEKEHCQKIVRTFPKNVYSKAPGISFNQAVVEVQGDKPSSENLKELEKRLRIQRNKATPQTETGLRIMLRVPRTGMPGTIVNKNEVMDKASFLKQQTYKTKTELLLNKLEIDDQYIFSNLIDDIAGKKQYVAIIHADGNNMGKVIRDLNESNLEQEPIELNKKFSSAINDITLNAAKIAIKNTFYKEFKGKTIPFRPVIIGGDDFTVICNAQYALELTKSYLKAFAEESSRIFEAEFNNVPTVTACAGIAFLKSSYPFHYGVKLAEDLCGFSKNEAKKINNNLVPSCLAFHRILSSFVGDYKDDIITRELTASSSGINFCGGPYYISDNIENTTSIDDLSRMTDCLKNENTPTSKLREWIYTCYVNKHLAKEDLKRIIQILNEKSMTNIVDTLKLQTLLDSMKIRNIDNSPLVKTSLYDAITIDSLNH